MILTDLTTKKERLTLIQQTASKFAERARKHDEAGTFPFENFDDLKRIGYPAMAVPTRYGGGGITLSEMLKCQEIIATYDGSTALSIGWHMGITKHIGTTKAWEENKYRTFAEDVIKNGALINNAASEAATGSPTRGGRPETTATKISSGWQITGRKTFTTLAPILDYFAASASIEGTDKVGNFLIHRERQGVEIDETWDSVAMKATGSHDLVLTKVELEDSDYLHELTPGKKQAQGWLLHIPACYLGIAKAAHTYALHFAKTYAPSSLPEGTIGDLPTVQLKLGKNELKLIESTTFLYAIARKWDESDESIRQTMIPELGAAKVSVVHNAIEVVDRAMQIVGARSLSATCPLQRYYRDVRAGLHNPPMEDMTLLQLAKVALEDRSE